MLEDDIGERLDFLIPVLSLIVRIRHMKVAFYLLKAVAGHERHHRMLRCQLFSRQILRNLTATLVNAHIYDQRQPDISPGVVSYQDRPRGFSYSLSSSCPFPDLSSPLRVPLRLRAAYLLVFLDSISIILGGHIRSNQPVGSTGSDSAGVPSRLRACRS